MIQTIVLVLGQVLDGLSLCIVVKRGLRQDGDAFRWVSGAVGVPQSARPRTWRSGSKVAQRGPRVGRHAATTESKSSKPRRQRGTGSRAAAHAVGKVGQPTKLANFTAGARRGTWYLPRGRFTLRLLGLGSWVLGPGAVRMVSDVTPTLPFTNLPADPSCVPKGGRHMRKQGCYTHHSHSHTLTPTPASRDSRHMPSTICEDLRRPTNQAEALTLPS